MKESSGRRRVSGVRMGLKEGSGGVMLEGGRYIVKMG